jgi:hypothetical protein
MAVGQTKEIRILVVAARNSTEGGAGHRGGTNGKGKDGEDRRGVGVGDDSEGAMLVRGGVSRQGGQTTLSAVRNVISWFTQSINRFVLRNQEYPRTAKADRSREVSRNVTS